MSSSWTAQTPTRAVTDREVTLVDRLTATLTERIANGTWSVGSRLPGERELASDFETSRVTIRQALRSLEAQGLLEVHGRAGVFVRTPSAGQVSDALGRYFALGPQPLTVRDLLEVRLLEIDVAGYAAERRTQEDLREIARALADGAITLAPAVGEAPAHDEIAAWSRTDVEFHAAIARATHNPLFAIIYEALHNVFLEQRMRTVGALPGTRQLSFRHHQEIFDRICVSDAAGARQAMQAHLAEARETLLLYTETDSELSVPVPPAR